MTQQQRCVLKLVSRRQSCQWRNMDLYNKTSLIGNNVDVQEDFGGAGSAFQTHKISQKDFHLAAKSWKNCKRSNFKLSFSTLPAASAIMDWEISLWTNKQQSSRNSGYCRWNWNCRPAQTHFCQIPLQHSTLSSSLGIQPTPKGDFLGQALDRHPGNLSSGSYLFCHTFL